MSIGSSPENLLETVSEGITQLTSLSVEGPYAFVVGPKIWSRMSAHFQGYPVKMQVENILGGAVILSPYLRGTFENEAFLVSTRGEDFELVLGQDLAIGYERSTPEIVTLYFTESLTFRVLEPAAVIDYSAST
jgi:uncharacterized linocin/CFP29 family protein